MSLYEPTHTHQSIACVGLCILACCTILIDTSTIIQVTKTLQTSLPQTLRCLPQNIVDVYFKQLTCLPQTLLRCLPQICLQCLPHTLLQCLRKIPKMSTSNTVDMSTQKYCRDANHKHGLPQSFSMSTLGVYLRCQPQTLKHYLEHAKCLLAVANSL